MKTESGLVAFCYMSDQYEVALFSEPPTDPLYNDMFPVVRLSDAEAIIAKLRDALSVSIHAPRCRGAMLFAGNPRNLREKRGVLREPSGKEKCKSYRVSRALIDVTKIQIVASSANLPGFGRRLGFAVVC